MRRAQALARRAGTPSDRAPSSPAHPGAYVAALAAQLDAEQARERGAASRAGGSPLAAHTAMPPPPELATPVADSLRAWSRASEALLRREARTHAATPVQPSTPPLHLAMHSRPVHPRTTSAHARAPHTPFSAPLDPPCTHPAPTLHPPCTHPAPTLNRPCTHPAPRRAALRRSGCSRSCSVRRSTERRIRSRARRGRTWWRFAAYRSARRSAPSLRWRTKRCGTRWRRSTSRTSHSRCAEKPTLRRCCATKQHLNVAPAPALILAASKSPSLPPSLPLTPATWPQLLPHSRPYLRQARRGGARVCTRRTEPLPR